MIIRGRIDLYYKDGTMLRSRCYHSKTERAEFIDMWKQQYGKKYHQTYIHIQPYFDTERVGNSGKTYDKYKKMATIRRIENAFN